MDSQFYVQEIILGLYRGRLRQQAFGNAIHKGTRYEQSFDVRFIVHEPQSSGQHFSHVNSIKENANVGPARPPDGLESPADGRYLEYKPRATMEMSSVCMAPFYPEWSHVVNCAPSAAGTPSDHLQ